jgi:putative ABC transport system substrate-binding protein
MPACQESSIVDSRRRKLIGLFGVALVWPLAARAQQASSRPVIGFLNIASPEAWGDYVAGFKQGLAQTGFVVAANVEIEYR